jgi:Ca2+-transporting ATPase
MRRAGECILIFQILNSVFLGSVAILDLTRYGTNTFEESPPLNLFKLFFSVWRDHTVIILTVAAIVSIILGLAVPSEVNSNDSGWIDGVAILVAVIIVAVVTTFNEWSKDKQFRNLNKKKEETFAKVIRDGERVVVDTRELYVGDITRLEPGDQIACDGVLVEGYDLKVDESSITGESMPARKNELDAFLFSGSTVTDGMGVMLVLSVGMNSQWGGIIRSVESSLDEKKTPLQEKLADLAELIGKIGLGVAIGLFLILTIWWFFNDFWGSPWEAKDFKKLVNNFIVAVTIVVVAVPEGLPLAVTISLAYSVKQMMHDQNLVRHLDACETMGVATTICSDKTGTLTENRMSVVEGRIGDIEFSSVPLEVDLPEHLKDLISEGISINSTADVEMKQGEPINYIGNKTECALLKFVKDLGVEYRQWRSDAAPAGVLCFSSERKRMSTLIERTGDVHNYRLHIKGQPELLLKLCDTIVDRQGQVTELNAEKKEELKQYTEHLAKKGLRTLFLGYRNFRHTAAEAMTIHEENEAKLTALAIVGIADPLRREAAEAVNQCKKAGICVRMVTGDNLQTAIKIAEECGILTNDEVAIDASEFRALSDEQVNQLLPRLRVLARSTPLDKLNLVNKLRDMSEVVAVTGDGTNDAAALKAADVGLAMGLSGTDVAKRASDVIILDDNFASIVKAVMWGRNINDNIKKFLQFQLTTNFVALVTATVTATSNYGMPLRAIQLLWVNLIMDSMAALALGTEKPTRDVLDRTPTGRQGRLITPRMLKNIGTVGVYQCLVLLGMVYFGPTLFNIPAGKSVDGPSAHYTMIFNTFVFIQIFNEINCRKINDEINVFKGIFTNWIFVGIIVFTAIVQVVFVQIGGNFFSTTPLSAYQWGICLLVAASILPLGFIVRLIPLRNCNARAPPLKYQKLATDSEDELQLTIEG